MSRGGPGNFDSDLASDFLFEAVVQPLERRIRDAAARPRRMRPTELGDEMICSLELLGHIAAGIGIDVLPSAEEIVAWREAYLAEWDRVGGDLPNDAFRRARRKVIVRTFDRLPRIKARIKADVAKAVRKIPSISPTKSRGATKGARGSRKR